MIQNDFPNCKSAGLKFDWFLVQENSKKKQENLFASEDGQSLAVLWVGVDVKEWYIGFYLSEVYHSVCVDHSQNLNSNEGRAKWIRQCRQYHVDTIKISCRWYHLIY